jgi:hypothetical protein
MESSLAALKNTLEEIVKDPAYRDVLSLVKTARNGAVYGAKVRFPHALVMIFLFRSGTYVLSQLDAAALAPRSRSLNYHEPGLTRFCADAI